MSIKIKISKKPIEYKKAISLLQSRAEKLSSKCNISELIWVLEHPPIYTGGTSHLDDEILDKSIDVIKTNRGGKVTFHGPGQIIFYVAINLGQRKKDIRWFIKILEQTIIQTLSDYKIKAYADRRNIGIWVNYGKKKRKIGAIGLKVRKWVVYHGFSLNLSVNIDNFFKIKPCGLKSEQISNLKEIKKDKFLNIKIKLINNFIKNLNI